MGFLQYFAQLMGHVSLVLKRMCLIYQDSLNIVKYTEFWAESLNICPGYRVAFPNITLMMAKFARVICPYFVLS